MENRKEKEIIGAIKKYTQSAKNLKRALEEFTASRIYLKQIYDKHHIDSTFINSIDAPQEAQMKNLNGQ